MAALIKKAKTKAKRETGRGGETLEGQSLAERVLLSVRVTEKAYVLNGLNQYVFKIAKDATKTQVKRAVEAAYGVTVERVRTINVAPRKRAFGRTMGTVAGMRKAIVTLPKGEEITLFKGA